MSLFLYVKASVRLRKKKTKRKVGKKSTKSECTLTQLPHPSWQCYHVGITAAHQ